MTPSRTTAEATKHRISHVQRIPPATDATQRGRQPCPPHTALWATTMHRARSTLVTSRPNGVTPQASTSASVGWPSDPRSPETARATTMVTPNRITSPPIPNSTRAVEASGRHQAWFGPRSSCE